MFGLDAVGISHPDVVLDVARHRAPDLFLIDVMLPKTSGIEVAEDLRRNGFAQTPMVALSASSIMQDLARHSGVFDGVLAKPFDIDRLLATIQEAVIDAARYRQTVSGNGETVPASRAEI